MSILRSNTLRGKITLVICSLIIVGALLGMGLGYYAGYALIHNTLVEHRLETAKVLSSSISYAVDREIEISRAISLDMVLAEYLGAFNSQYKEIDKEGIEKLLLLKDKIWGSTIATDSFYSEYLDNFAAQKIREFMTNDNTIAEILLTDYAGGLVAASNMSSDFYQADEEWWQDSYDDGRGKMTIGDFYFDESAGVNAFYISIPVKDDNGKILGICKVVISVDAFVGPFEDIHFGETGRVYLYNASGESVVRKDSVGTELSGYIHDYIGDFTVGGDSFYNIAEVDGKKVFTIETMVVNDTLLNNGVIWTVLIAQDAREAFKPLKTYLSQGAGVAIVLFLILVPLGYLLTGLLTKPLNRLSDMTAKINRDNYRELLKIETGDEIGRLAIIIQNIFGDLIQRQDELIEAKRKIENTSIDLEAKVERRTKEIEESQAATLNIMEDLQDAYEKVKEAQEQLIQVEKMDAVGRMASGVAHEVKNPLGIIIQGVNFLEHKIPKSSDEERDILGLIKRNVMRADTIVRALVDFSRASKLEMNSENVNDVVDSSVRLIEHTARNKEIILSQEKGEHLPEVMIDRGKIEQVLVNLLNNAIDAVPPGKGKISVRTFIKQVNEAGGAVGKRTSDKFKPGEKIVAIEIKDNGAGIPESNKKKMFEPFFTTKGPKKGTGLGLAVSKNILDMHNATIELDSELGSGTKFTVNLKII